MDADTPQYTGQRHFPHNNFNGFFVFADLDHGQVALNIDAGRAGQGTGSPVCLVDGKFSGNGLGEMAINRLAHSHVRIKIR